MIYPVDGAIQLLNNWGQFFTVNIQDSADAYFSFVKDRRRSPLMGSWSSPFLTVHATIGNQAFSQNGCNIFPWLSYNKANNTFLNSPRKNEVDRPKLSLR